MQQRLIDADKHIEYLNAKRDVCLRFNDVLGAQIYEVAIDEIKGADSIDAEPVVHCKDCIYWQDRKVLMKNGEYRDYLSNEDMFVSIDKGINEGSHCTLHGYENMSGSWVWAQANDFCSKGKRRNCAKMDEEQG